MFLIVLKTFYNSTIMFFLSSSIFALFIMIFEIKPIHNIIIVRHIEKIITTNKINNNCDILYYN